MAEIQLAVPRSGACDRPVALKRMLPALAADADFVAMFLDEARITQQLRHDNVCRLVDVGFESGEPFLVLEFMRGASLLQIMRDCVRRGERIAPELAVQICMQACLGLHALHQLRDDRGRSVSAVHRDVSPGNVFVTLDGVVKILDLGIAKARWMAHQTRAGVIKGKTAYMSPEQALGLPVNARSDVFSLGIVLWELLAEAQLFGGDTDSAKIGALLRAEVPSITAHRPDVSEPLAAVIDRALSRDQNLRYATMLDLHQALREIAAQMPAVAARDVGAWVAARFGKPLRAVDHLVASAAQETTAPVRAAVAPRGARAQGKRRTTYSMVGRDKLTDSITRVWRAEPAPAAPSDRKANRAA